jgi:hypothetical protein
LERAGVMKKNKEKKQYKHTPLSAPSPLERAGVRFKTKK